MNFTFALWLSAPTWTNFFLEHRADVNSNITTHEYWYMRWYNIVCVMMVFGSLLHAIEHRALLYHRQTHLLIFATLKGVGTLCVPPSLFIQFGCQKDIIMMCYDEIGLCSKHGRYPRVNSLARIWIMCNKGVNIKGGCEVMLMFMGYSMYLMELLEIYLIYFQIKFLIPCVCVCVVVYKL